MRLYLLPAAAVLVLTACATGPTHDSKVAGTLTATSQGDISGAIKQLETQTEGANKADFLLNLEKGELMRIGSRYKESLAAFEVADAKVNAWEATAKSNPAKLMGQVGAVLMGDNSRDYEGQDYEKVMLTTRMAMDRISLGDLDTARVDIKRTHEREAVIAEFRAKETAAAEKEAEEKGVKPTGKELDGYPVETLNDPEVLKLKNGFQNAWSHYMAGFVYEALNEPSMAAPGYRKAIELRPDLPVLEEGLRGLDSRTGFRRQKGATDVLFVVESGNAPARKSQKIFLPIPTRRGLITVGIAFPVIYPDKNALNIDQINLGSMSLPTALITDFNVMARKSLKDELPGIQLRSAVRAISKGLLQDQANKQLGPLAGLIGNVLAAATEPEADDRLWRALPGRVFIARSFVTPGEYDLGIPGQADGVKKITVDGRYMVVPVRVFRNKTYFGEPVQFGSAGVIAALVPAVVEKPKRTALTKRRAKKSAAK
ncbi:MAG: COG3014 family protein [Burkholderiaceae bacterium]